MSSTEALRTLALDLAKGAGTILLEMLPGKLSTKSSPTDLVTDADRAAEKYIFEELMAARPDDSILSEEGSVHEGTSGITWVVDPLDGTVNYVYDIPQWCVSIGIEGQARAGVVYDPKRNEIFTDETPMTPSSQTELADALIGTGFAYAAQTRRIQGELLSHVLPKVRDVRRAGSCALDLAWVACGRLDGFYEDATNHWDVSAGMALIESAGGIVKRIDRMTIAAGNEELFEKLFELVRVNTPREV